jgi:hypothetical protein
MQGLLKILLLVLVIQLPLNAVAETSSTHGWVDIQSTEDPQSPLGYPIGFPNLYAIHHQAESPAEITNRVPQVLSTTERKNESFKSSAPESVIERWLIFWIRFGELIEPGLTAQKLIFPFHFFL